MIESQINYVADALAVMDATDAGQAQAHAEAALRLRARRFVVGRGTGLGLATAQRIVVEHHKGSITFESEPGRTTFHVSLPFTQR